MYPKVRLIEETKGGGKDRKIANNNNKICHICVGTRHKEKPGWGQKDKEVQ
jgi:hypothetical protein